PPMALFPEIVEPMMIAVESREVSMPPPKANPPATVRRGLVPRPPWPAIAELLMTEHDVMVIMVPLGLALLLVMPPPIAIPPGPAFVAPPRAWLLDTRELLMLRTA